MEYPKPIMSITELEALGFSKTELKYAVHARGQNFAVKTHGGGKWKIDTEKFEKWRTRGIGSVLGRRWLAAVVERNKMKHSILSYIYGMGFIISVIVAASAAESGSIPIMIASAACMLMYGVLIKLEEGELNQWKRKMKKFFGRFQK